MLAVRCGSATCRKAPFSLMHSNSKIMASCSSAQNTALPKPLTRRTRSRTSQPADALISKEWSISRRSPADILLQMGGHIPRQGAYPCTVRVGPNRLPLGNEVTPPTPIEGAASIYPTIYHGGYRAYILVDAYEATIAPPRTLKVLEYRATSTHRE